MRESVIYTKIKASKLPKDSKLFTGKRESLLLARPLGWIAYVSFKLLPSTC